MGGHQILIDDKIEKGFLDEDEKVSFFLYIHKIVKSSALDLFVSQSPWKFRASHFETDSGLYIYHLSVWSNFNLLHNSQWITFPTQSCLLWNFYVSVCCIRFCFSSIITEPILAILLYIFHLYFDLLSHFYFDLISHYVIWSDG